VEKKGEELTGEVKDFIGDVTEDVKEFIQESEKRYEQLKKNISEKISCQ
jgi:uncharacterized protein YjbJ (UPF0337 family)